MSDRRRELEDLQRQQVEADLDILRGLQRRAQLARRIGELGPQGGPPDMREQVAQLIRLAGDELSAEIVGSVFRQVHAATSSLERPARIAFAGPEGGFCQVAAVEHFGLGATFMAVESSEQALDDVRRRRADFAVFPFESSSEGPLQNSVEALAATDLSLAAKIEVSTRLSLLGSEGLAKGAVSKLHVTKSDWSAIENYAASLTDVTVAYAATPLEACRAAQQDSASGAIAPQATGELLGLSVIETDISDRHDLRMRYGLASSRPASRSGADTTALVFGVNAQPGALFDVLKHFAERSIDVTTIQSRPLPGETWAYIYYVEVAGHATDRALVTVLEEVKRQTRLLKVLGSFPSC